MHLCIICVNLGVRKDILLPCRSNAVNKNDLASIDSFDCKALPQKVTFNSCRKKKVDDNILRQNTFKKWYLHSYECRTLRLFYFQNTYKT